MWKFKAEIKIIGINPFVFVPEEILKEVFYQAGKDKGQIPVCGTVNDKPYIQTLLRYIGEWRLYINTFMLTDSPKRIGEVIEVSIAFDNADRTIKPHPRLVAALDENPEAKVKFDRLAPSAQKEIIRYISSLKTEGSIDKNIRRAIQHLVGNGPFIGRKTLNNNRRRIMETKFEGGINIAIKIPKSKYDQTVAFYRDILKFEVEEKPINNPTVSRTHQVTFGSNIMWLDCVDNYTHSETWLELNTDNVENATDYLNSKGVQTCDELEQLPENMHWITDPAGTVFIVKKR